MWAFDVAVAVGSGLGFRGIWSCSAPWAWREHLQVIYRRQRPLVSY